MAFSIPLSFAGLIDFSTALAQAAPAPTERWKTFVPWIVGSAIVVVGLFVYGWSDLIRTHWRRVWAISSVCVTESLRRKVLWLTPLAVVGVVIVSQFQHSVDAQDSIRQATKFCIFTSGLLVTMTAIILACTNLPREIENRVIYTIVTKPTTRLEIVLGKVLGFARVTALILIIMGGFTLLYLEVKAHAMVGDLKVALKNLPADSPVRTTDTYYIDSGLLGTRSLDWADDMQVYSRPPEGDEHWFAGGEGEYVLLPFDLTAKERSDLSEIAQTDVADIPIYFNVFFDVERLKPTEKERQEAEDMKLVEGMEQARHDYNIPLPSTVPAGKEAALIPQAAVRFLDELHRPIVPMNVRDAGQILTLTPRKPGEPWVGTVRLPANIIQAIAAVGRIEAQVSARTPAIEFGVRGNAATISCPLPQLPPINLMRDPADSSRPAPASFGTHPGRQGWRLPVIPAGRPGPVAVFGFHDTDIHPGRDGKVGLQVAVHLEHSGDVVVDAAHPAGYMEASVEVRNRKTGQSSGQIVFSPETSRTQPILVDAKYLEGGNFEVLLRNTTPGQTLGIEGGADPGEGAAKSSVAIIAADRNFVFNLCKSLFILWLLSLLVVIIAVFCSTFVSWPIAFVLTVVILLAHWGVNQLGDTLKEGIAGRTATTQWGISNPTESYVVSTGIDKLSAMLRFISNFLPDVAQFPVMEDIEKGISIPMVKVRTAIGVVFCFGLPMLVVSYVILRRKEVAP